MSLPSDWTPEEKQAWIDSRLCIFDGKVVRSGDVRKALDKAIEDALYGDDEALKDGER